MAEISAAEISEKFLRSLGKSGFHFLSFRITTLSWFSKSKMLSTIKQTTKAMILSRMSCKQMKGETNKQIWKNVGNRSINSNLCFLMDGI